MSVQIALGAPATRVASRKLGPVAGSRSGGSGPASSVRAACATSTFASTCGRCETVARIVSWVSGVDRDRRARRACAATGAGARTGCPKWSGVGVRYQVAPSNRSARACRHRPSRRRPADGRRRTSGRRGRPRSARLVEPTSVTTQASRSSRSSAAVDGGRQRARPGPPRTPPRRRPRPRRCWSQVRRWHPVRARARARSRRRRTPRS